MPRRGHSITRPSAARRAWAQYSQQGWMLLPYSFRRIGCHLLVRFFQYNILYAYLPVFFSEKHNIVKKQSISSICEAADETEKGRGDTAVLPVDSRGGNRRNSNRATPPLHREWRIRHFQNVVVTTRSEGNAAANCPCTERPPQPMHRLSHKGANGSPYSATQPQLTSKMPAMAPWI